MAIRGAISKLYDSSETFFKQFENDLNQSPDHCVRIRQKGYYGDNISYLFSNLKQILKEYAENQDDSSFKTELNAQLRTCEDFEYTVSSFIQMVYDKHVYWCESHQTGGNRQNTELTSAPLNVSSLLREMLFQTDIPVILTSATLAVHDSLDYFASRVGFCRGEGLILDSPFNYWEQVTLYLSRQMPQPHEESYS